jgi:hypothetical protein
MKPEKKNRIGRSSWRPSSSSSAWNLSTNPGESASLKCDEGWNSGESASEMDGMGGTTMSCPGMKHGPVQRSPYLVL